MLTGLQAISVGDTGEPRPSAKEVHFLLETIINAKAAQKHLEDIQQAEASMIKERNALTKARDLDRALEKSKSTQKKAQDTLDQALDHAGRVKNEANHEAKTIVLKAQQQAQDITNDVLRMKDQIQSDLNDAERLKKEAENAKTAIDREREELSEKKKAVAALQAEFAEKLDKLKQITG